MKTSTIITENSMEYLITTDKKTGKSRRYCLETNPEIWQPTYPGEICPEYMLRFCRAKGLKDLEWYVGLLEGKIKKVAANTYIITPYSVDIEGDLIDELENNGLYF